MGKRYHCYYCNKYKLKSEFIKDSSRSCGMSSRCRECNKEYIKNYVKNYEKRKKYLVRKSLQNAVISGKVRKECCEICGNAESQGHHFDYDKPFDVIWLCSAHHGLIHRKI